MISYSEIKCVHLEISTRCNAACPDCPRNFKGVDCINNYPVTDLSLTDAKTIFPVEFLQQLKLIYINGNLGDFITARDGLNIVTYFLEANPNLDIIISTNASGNPKIWGPLGKLGVTVHFRIDGLEDTHKLYRQQTDFNFILQNAQKFIAAGGHAVWMMILFDHNKHQVEACRQLADDLGFKEFKTVDEGRNTFPVFNKDKTLSHIVGPYNGSTNFDKLYNDFVNYDYTYTGHAKDADAIECFSIEQKEIYICANGDVYPCCWLGFYPNHNFFHSAIQIKPLIKNNNALIYGIEKSIEWFNEVEKTWSQSVSNGRILVCNDTCGKCKTKE